MITTDSKSHIANDTDQSTESTNRLSFVSYLGRKRIPNLDGLRGIAILLILIHHVPCRVLTGSLIFNNTVSMAYP